MQFRTISANQLFNAYSNPYVPSQNNVNVVGSNQRRSFQINGDLEVTGDIKVGGNSAISDIEIINKRLLEENIQLKSRIEKLEEKLEMLWYAPGMPGYVMSSTTYDGNLTTPYQCEPIDDVSNALSHI